MFKKYIRLLTWRLLNYTERWFGLDEIIQLILREEYTAAQIRLDKLRDIYGNDPRFVEIQMELDIAKPFPLSLINHFPTSDEDRLVFSNQELN